MTLPEILSASRFDDASLLLRDYYTEPVSNGAPRTGSRFDNWAGGGDRSDVADTLTADDVVAVSFLSIDFPAEAAIGLLEARADDVTTLLQEIPTKVTLSEVTLENRDALLGPDSAAHKLWHLLRGTSSSRWGIGATTASKIMARKRPHLIPIYDSVVGPLMGLKDSRGQWDLWHAVLTTNTDLPERLRDLRTSAGVSEEISELRVMDVVLWMHGSKGYQGQE